MFVVVKGNSGNVQTQIRQLIHSSAPLKVVMCAHQGHCSSLNVFTFTEKLKIKCYIWSPLATQAFTVNQKWLLFDLSRGAPQLFHPRSSPRASDSLLYCSCQVETQQKPDAGPLALDPLFNPKITSTLFLHFFVFFFVWAF